MIRIRKVTRRTSAPLVTDSGATCSAAWQPADGPAAAGWQSFRVYIGPVAAGGYVVEMDRAAAESVARQIVRHLAGRPRDSIWPARDDAAPAVEMPPPGRGPDAWAAAAAALPDPTGAAPAPCDGCGGPGATPSHDPRANFALECPTCRALWRDTPAPAPFQN